MGENATFSQHYSDFWEFDPNVNGIVEFKNQIHISVFPNPSNGKFQISCERLKIKEVAICNLQGETIYQSSINDFKSEIDISSHPKGIYLLKVLSAGKMYMDKIIVQ